MQRNTAMFKKPLPKDVHKYKLVLLGEAGVGKSSLALRLVQKRFLDYQESSIGAAFLTHDINLPNSNSVAKFEIWDTAGQERYHSLATMYYRGASAAVVVYDVTCQSSFVRAQSWVNELKRESNDMVIALVGNKIDLSEDLHRVSLKDVALFASAQNLLVFESSAKTDQNVNIIFETIAVKLPKLAAQLRNIVIDEAEPQEQKRKCCP